MTILFFAIFLLVALLVLFGLAAAVRAMAYDLDRRYLHCRTLLAVFLVVIAAANVYVVTYPIQFIDKLLNSPVLAPLLSVILPNRAYALLYMLLMVLLLNLLMALVVLIAVAVVKWIFRKKRNYVNPDDYYGFEQLLHFPWFLANRYYETEEGVGQLNYDGVTAGIWAKGMRNVFAGLMVLEILMLAVSVLWGGEDWNERLRNISKAWYLLPMAAYLITDQLALFLEAGEDYEAGSFASDSIGESLTGDITSLLGVYEATFRSSGALLYAEMGDSRLQRRVGLDSNDLGSRQKQDCDQPRVLEFISKQLRESGVRQCDNYQNALVQLLNGNSINVRDSLDGEFLSYLAAYLNYYLSQGRTALVLCRDAEQAASFAGELRDCLCGLNSLYSVWSICSVKEADAGGRVNILVCSSKEMMDSRALEKHPDFAEDLFCVVIADGFGLFAQDGMHIELLFDRLRKTCGSQQYIIISEVDNDNLRTAGENSIKQELIPFNNDARLPNISIMIWKEESSFKLQQYLGVGNALSPHMGSALPLALVGAKCDLPQIYLIGDNSRGDHTFQNVLTMSNREVYAYLDRNTNLASVIRYDPQEAMVPQDISMIIAYDTDYNFFNALWRWMKYGGRAGTLLHIVSPPYLLRDYFAANIVEKQLLLKNNEFDALIPYSQILKISRMAVLLTTLSGGGMTEEELMEKSLSYGWTYDNVEALLQDCLRVVLRKEEIHSIHEHFRFRAEKHFLGGREGFVRTTKVILIDELISRRLLARVEYGYLISYGNQRTQLDILCNNLSNYYLRGQLAVFGGYLYRINRIRGENIYAEQEMPQSIPQYFPISEFSFENYTIDDACVDTPYLDLNLCSAHVERRIYGYWAGIRGNDFTDPSVLHVNALQDDDSSMIVSMDNANILEMRIRREALGEHPEKAALLLAYMLSELFKTLFPAIWQNLYAVTSASVDGGLTGRVFSAGADCSIEDKIRSIIPWCNASERDGNCITLYIVEFSCVEYGMAQMLYVQRDKVFQMLREYLSWYLAAAADGGAAQGDAAEAGAGVSRTPYLHFGGSELPGAFAAKELFGFLEKIAPAQQQPVLDKDVAPPSGTSVCTFCGRQVLFTTRLEDGRCMCSHCKDHQLSRRDEIKSLFIETVQFMEKGYHIDLRRNIHVRFLSAEAISRITSETPGTRILGFYNNRNHQLVLESRGPRIAMQSTLFHELAHTWQYDELDLKALLRALPMDKREHLLKALMEGHAMYVEIHAMEKLNEISYAERIDRVTMAGSDIYSEGYRLIRDYIREKEQEGSHMNPFTAMAQLVSDIIEGRKTIS